MSTTYVAFDTRTGRILSVHHGAVDASHAREGCAQHHAKISDEHIAVITVPSDAVERGKQYKVDVGRNVLVAVVADKDGVGFGFGVIGRLRGAPEAEARRPVQGGVAGWVAKGGIRMDEPWDAECSRS